MLLTIPYLPLLSAWACTAHPNPIPSAPSQPPSLLALNLTLPPPLLILPSTPRAGITCFATGSRTTVSGCRRALNYIKEFPHYKTIQPFQEGRSPVLENGKKPPLLIFAGGATCAIGVASRHRLVVDAFSFEEVRRLATEIVEDCQDLGGSGGWSGIGRGVGWHVKVIGVEFGVGSLLVKGVEAGKGRLEMEVEGGRNGSVLLKGRAEPEVGLGEREM